MAIILFYEKPGCKNNTQQKELLKAAGHQLQVKNLLTEAWTMETLRPFFGSLPVEAWFNRSAPRIQSGEVNPSGLDEASALQLMMVDPLLIRRPLMQVDTEYQVGFDQEQVDRWVGLETKTAPTQDLENCPKKHQKTPCPPPN